MKLLEKDDFELYDEKSSAQDSREEDLIYIQTLGFFPF